jgi:hypothetical protein
MQARQLLTHILDDDALTRGLGDEEARVLVVWLVAEAERLAAADPPDPRAEAQVVGLCRRARAIGRFVELWCHRGLTGPAGQLANAEAFGWELPAADVDPCDLMRDIVRYEQHQRAEARAA